MNNERIGALEVCYLEEKPELEEGPFIKETKKLSGYPERTSGIEFGSGFHRGFI